MRLQYFRQDLFRLQPGRRALNETVDDIERIIELMFENAQSQPALMMVTISVGPIAISISRNELPAIRLKYDDAEVRIESERLPRDLFRAFPAIRNELFWFIRPLEEWVFGDAILEQAEIPESRRSILKQIAQEVTTLTRFSGGTSVYASAPIRTEPLRTYSPIEALSSAEGSHIPILLAQLKSFDSKQWTVIRDRLIAFGKRSGLFQEIDIKRLGRSNSDPFQLMITVSKVRSNIIDVGYGISQVLPIVVELLMNNNSLFFLFQQPEVHLHPSGQAELGSFFLEHVLRTKKTIILETHSDYIVDRIRSEIVRKNQKPSDILSLLYFQKEPFETIIHPIEVDGSGQIVNPPPGYRTFFMKESLRVLGLD